MKFEKADSSIVKAIKKDPGKHAILQDAIDAFKTVPTLTYLSVSGIEVSQAIQYWHPGEHLTDSADQGTDNSVKLVVDKLTCTGQRPYMINR